MLRASALSVLVVSSSASATYAGGYDCFCPSGKQFHAEEASGYCASIALGIKDAVTSNPDTCEALSTAVAERGAVCIDSTEYNEAVGDTQASETAEESNCSTLTSKNDCESFVLNGTSTCEWDDPQSYVYLVEGMCCKTIESLDCMCPGGKKWDMEQSGGLCALGWALAYVPYTAHQRGLAQPETQSCEGYETSAKAMQAECVSDETAKNRMEARAACEAGKSSKEACEAIQFETYDGTSQKCEWEDFNGLTQLGTYLGCCVGEGGDADPCKTFGSTTPGCISQWFYSTSSVCGGDGTQVSFMADGTCQPLNVAGTIYGFTKITCEGGKLTGGGWQCNEGCTVCTTPDITYGAGAAGAIPLDNSCSTHASLGAVSYKIEGVCKSEISLDSGAPQLSLFPVVVTASLAAFSLA